MKKHIRHKKHRPRNRIAFFLRSNETDELFTSFSVTRDELNKLNTVGKMLFGINHKHPLFYNMLFTKLLEEMIKRDGELYDKLKTD